MRDARETHGIWLYATPDQIQGRHAPAVKNVRAETGPRDRAVLKSFFMLSSFLSPFSQAKFHSALCVKRGEPADRPERKSDRREESADRCEAEQSGRTRRTEKGDTALFRSSAGRVLTRRRAVSCQRTRRKGRRSRASSTISLHARAWCALMLRLPAACGLIYVASWTATTGSDDAALRDG